MATSNIGNRKHLTLSDRIQIETGLEKGMNFTQIAKLLHKDSSTIPKEIRRHLFCVPHYSQDMQKKRSECAYFSSCDKRQVCGRSDCMALCTKCRSRRCSMFCRDFTPKICEKLKKPPYVCNTCGNLRNCSHDFYFIARNMQMTSITKSKRLPETALIRLRNPWNRWTGSSRLSFERDSLLHISMQIIPMRFPAVCVHFILT